jgi:cold shock protein
MTEENKVIGNVRWFDQRKGFGFLKVISPESEFFEKEIFIHYSSINCNSEFKKVFPGENVSLNVHDNGSEGEGNKRYNSENITGVYDSPLLVDNEGYMYKVVQKRG